HALEVKHVSKEKVNVKNCERENIESSMVHYRYGPWDFRYRRFVNIMIGKGLMHVHIDGKTTQIGLTQKGFDIYKELSNAEVYADISKRSKLLKRNFDLSGTNLMKFIYSTFPEISTLRFGERI
ncbi:MAG: hypothetical protein KAJ40_03640, partial [Alphaproteobacteria bacterium]|nr:hypothetical protein [Alphaproteobacteria bacterium]